MARQALASTKERNNVTKRSQRRASDQSNKRSGDDRGTRFKKGQSGNPKGRPKGIKDRRVKYRELLEPHASELVKKAVELALAGDTTSLRLCLERIVPSIKSQDEPVKLGELEGTLPEQGAAIVAAMGAGQVSPSEAAVMLQALAAQARIVEVDDLEKRVTVLEDKNGRR